MNDGKPYKGVRGKFYNAEQIQEIKIKCRPEIEKKKQELEEQYRLRLEQERQEALELEKTAIRAELLENERKRKLKRQLKKELIEEGLIDKHKKREAISQEVKDSVWVRDGGKCVQCGSNENLEFDHIIPFSKGGANTYRNIQLLCEKCNREKSDKIGEA